MAKKIAKEKSIIKAKPTTVVKQGVEQSRGLFQRRDVNDYDITNVSQLKKAYRAIYSDYATFVKDIDYAQEPAPVAKDVEKANHGFWDRMKSTFSKIAGRFTHKEIESAVGKETYDQYQAWDKQREKAVKSDGKTDSGKSSKDSDMPSFSAPMTTSMAALIKLKFSEHAYLDMQGNPASAHTIYSTLQRAHAVIDNIAMSQGLDIDEINKTANVAMQTMAQDNPGMTHIYNGFSPASTVIGTSPSSSILPRIPSNPKGLSVSDKFREFVEQHMAGTTIPKLEYQTATKEPWIQGDKAALAVKKSEMDNKVADRIVDVTNSIAMAAETMRSGKSYIGEPGVNRNLYLSAMQFLTSMSTSAITEGDTKQLETLLKGDASDKNSAAGILTKAISDQIAGHPSAANVMFENNDRAKLVANLEGSGISVAGVVRDFDAQCVSDYSKVIEKGKAVNQQNIQIIEGMRGHREDTDRGAQEASDYVHQRQEDVKRACEMADKEVMKSWANESYVNPIMKGDVYSRTNVPLDQYSDGKAQEKAAAAQEFQQRETNEKHDAEVISSIYGSNGADVNNSYAEQVDASDAHKSSEKKTEVEVSTEEGVKEDISEKHISGVETPSGINDSRKIPKGVTSVEAIRQRGLDISQFAGFDKISKGIEESTKQVSVGSVIKDTESVFKGISIDGSDSISVDASDAAAAIMAEISAKGVDKYIESMPDREFRDHLLNFETNFEELSTATEQLDFAQGDILEQGFAEIMQRNAMNSQASAVSGMAQNPLYVAMHMAKDKSALADTIDKRANAANKNLDGLNINSIETSEAEATVGFDFDA